MRPLAKVALGIVLGCAGLVSPALAQEGYRHGRLRFVEPGVSIQRATDTVAEEALANMPFLPGDRVWTDANGRVEFQFPDATIVRLDRRSKLDYSGHEEDRDERIILRLWSGSLFLRGHERNAAQTEVETPGGTVLPRERSLVRVDVDAGEARVSVLWGEAVLDDGQSRVQLAQGERTYSRWGDRAEDPQGFDESDQDDFARWEADRESSTRWASSSPYLPGELEPYGGELQDYGDWRQEAEVGYVWVPRVDVGWRPYWNGHWAWTPYGWTWIPYERWGWAPFHYGRWDYSAYLGWYWVPGRSWSPAWVSWAVGGGYVGWCPLGRHNTPVVAWGSRHEGGVDRGHAVPRRRGGSFEAWSVLRQGELGRRNVARLRVPLEGVQVGAVQLGVSPRERPTRDGGRLAEGPAVPRAIRTRPTPGDFVRELAVDNKTTIPSPWFRRGRAVGREGGAVLMGAGSGTPAEGAVAGAATRGAAGGEPGETGVERGRARGESGGARRESGGASPAPRSSRPAPWFAPTSGGSEGSDGSGNAGGAVRRGPRGGTGSEPGSVRPHAGEAGSTPSSEAGSAPSGEAGTAPSGARPRSSVRPFWRSEERGEEASANGGGSGAGSSATGGSGAVRREAPVPFWRGPQATDGGSGSGPGGHASGSSGGGASTGSVGRSSSGGASGGSQPASSSAGTGSWGGGESSHPSSGGSQAHSNGGGSSGGSMGARPRDGDSGGSGEAHSSGGSWGGGARHRRE